MLTRDQIVAIQDTRVRKVAVPEWGGDVYVRTISGDENDRIAKREFGDRTRGVLAAVFLSDADGRRLFDDSDAEMLGSKSYTALDAIIEAGLGHNAMGDADVDGLEGNSGETPENDSGSA